MKLRQGPRPWSIRIFAILFIAQALIALAFGFVDLEKQLAIYSQRYPELGLSRDWMIVTLFARLTIAAIPIVLIWFVASSFARWMATALAAVPVFQFPGFFTIISNEGYVDFHWLVPTLLRLAAVAFLFAPTASRWFSREDFSPATFE